MEYMVKSINPSRQHGSGRKEFSESIQNAINTYVDQDWEFVSVEQVSTWVAGSNGCFGFGAKPGYYETINLIIFRK